MSDANCWYVVVNPVSGGGRAARYWVRLRAALDRLQVPHHCAESTAAGAATTLAAAALREGYRRFLAIGGDGTFNELVNGLASQHEVPFAQCLVAAAAAGTGNDWAQAMRIPEDAGRLASCLARRRTRVVDLGLAVHATGERRYFHNVAGAGLDAEVLRRMPRAGPRSLRYVAGVLRTIARFRAPEFRVTVDGQRISGCFWLALAANGPRCGGGMQLAPSAALDDGWLELVMLSPLSLPAALGKLPRLFNGRLAGDAAFARMRCRSVRIESTPPCGVELDGELAGVTPVTFSLIPGALQTLDCRESAE